MMAEWVLIIVLATGDAYELRVYRETCLEAPARVRADDATAARMSDGSLVPIIAAACIGPAEDQPQRGAGS